MNILSFKKNFWFLISSQKFLLPMKKNLKAALIISVFLSGIALQNLSAQASKDTIRAEEVSGEVVLIGEIAEDSRILNEGDIFEEGLTVATGNSGSVTLYFSNGSSVSIGPDTRLTIRSFNQEPFSSDKTYGDLRADPSVSNTLLFLENGSITVRTKELQENSTFRVISPSGTMDLKSATAQITHATSGNEGITILANLFGNIEAKDNDPNSPWITVEEGSLIEMIVVTDEEVEILEQITSEPRPIEASDLVPDIDLTIIGVGNNASPSN